MIEKIKITKNHLEQLSLELAIIIKKDIAKEGDVFRFSFNDKKDKLISQIDFEIIKSKNYEKQKKQNDGYKPKKRYIPNTNLG